MKKTYVLDTNVLLDSPEALFSFDDNDVVIPSTVLEELDNKKHGYDEINANAREVARKLYKLKQTNNNDLFQGVELENGGTLYICPYKEPNKDINFPSTWDDDKKDNEILKTCLALQQTVNNEVILVTKDIFLGIKADYLRIKNDDFKTNMVVPLTEQYTGQMEIALSEDDFITYNKMGYISLDKAFVIECTDDEYHENYNFATYPNEFLIIHNAMKYTQSTLLGKISKNGQMIEKLHYEKEHPFGVTPRNASQKFMQEALMASVSDTPLVVIKGPAGTAKTFYSLAVALERVFNGNNNNKEKFRKILVCRPNQTMDEEIGFLPGTEKEKIEPLMRPIFDNLEVLIDSDRDSRNENEEELQDKVAYIFENKMIDMQAVGYLRGRSIDSQFIIVDECFTGDTYVLGDNDRGYSIDYLYDLYEHHKKLPNVVSWNEKKNVFESKQIKNVVWKGKRDILLLKIGNRKIKCTENHPFLTINRGWVKAGDLTINDNIMVSNRFRHQVDNVLNDDQYQIVLGSYLGDGYIRRINNHRYTLGVCHGIKQKDYCLWKASMFDTNTKTIEHGGGYRDTDLIRFKVNTFVLNHDFEPHGKCHIPQWVIDDMDFRAIAIWYMDDGSIQKNNDYICFSTHSFDEDSVNRLSKKLLSLGVKNHVSLVKNRHDTDKKYPVIYVPKEGTEVLLKNIMPYMHSSMMYKTRFRKQKMIYVWDKEFKNYGAMVLKSIEKLNKKEDVYDIEVADNHTFAVLGTAISKKYSYIPKYYINYSNNKLSGIVVHNCQNLSSKVAKAIVTRAGEGTKIVFCGDPKQIDNQYVTEKTNGLSYLVENMKGSSMLAVIETDETDIVRSPLAKEAVTYLEKKKNNDF